MATYSSKKYPSGSVTSAQLADGTVVAVDLASNSVTNAKIADAAVGVAELSATGTASSSTFLRGDNSWQVVAVTPTAVSDQANSSTGYFDIPTGTTAERPGTPANGMVRLNSTSGYMEYYSSSYGWVTVASPYSVEVLIVAGGGGGSWGTGSGGSGAGGGSGGGGNGGAGSTNPTSGTANTGGGAGGSGLGGSGTPATGGSGIIIVRYSGSQRATGGTITSAGGYTYHTFTSSSTFTA